jgi:hypothetical protein
MKGSLARVEAGAQAENDYSHSVVHGPMSEKGNSQSVRLVWRRDYHHRNIYYGRIPATS